MYLKCASQEFLVAGFHSILNEDYEKIQKGTEN